MKTIQLILSVVPLFIISNSYSGQPLGKFINEETEGKFSLVGSTVSYPIGTNVTENGDEKTYSITQKSSDTYSRSMIVVKGAPGSLNRISILKDEDFQEQISFYRQKFSTFTVEGGKPSSITSCDLSINRERYTNKEYAEGKFDSYIHDKLWGTPKERLMGSCYTVTESICSNLKKEFADPDFKKLKSEMKSCQSFADKFSAAATKENYFADESKSKENIEAMSNLWASMNYNPKAEKKVQSNWVYFYNNLARGERESFSDTVKKFGLMLSLCERMEFASAKPATEYPAKPETKSK